MSKFHRLFENTQIHRAYFGAASAEPLEEASIAKMNRRAKAANAVSSSNPDSKNYSPKEISTIKKAVQDQIDDDTTDNFSRVEERKDGVYLVMDCYKNVHPNYLEVAGEYVSVEYSGSQKGGDWIKVPKDTFGGFVLEFRATIGKGGKVQYEFVDGKYDRGFVDAPITKDIVDSAADAAKRGNTSPHGGVDTIRGMIANKLNEADLIDVWGSNNFDLYEPYGDKYPMPRSPEVSSRWNRWRRR